LWPQRAPAEVFSALCMAARSETARPHRLLDRSTLRRQHVNLPKLRDNLFGRVANYKGGNDANDLGYPYGLGPRNDVVYHQGNCVGQ
jgi:hypothetical protein